MSRGNRQGAAAAPDRRDRPLTGAAGVAFAAVPFLASWKPSARAKALGAPVEIDISKLEPGAMLKIEWRGKPVLVVRRTPEMIERIGGARRPRSRDPGSENSRQPEYAQERRARDQARIPRAARRLHPPRLPAAEPLRGRARARTAC